MPKMVQSSVNNLSFFRNHHSLQAFGSKQSIKAKSVQSTQDNNLQEALRAIQGLGLNIEICGSWVWVFNADSSHEAKLRVANFNWSHKRGCWFFCPVNNKRCPRRQFWAMERIREKYGSQIVHG